MDLQEGHHQVPLVSPANRGMTTKAQRNRRQCPVTFRTLPWSFTARGAASGATFFSHLHVASLVGEIEVYGAGWGFASGRVHGHEN